MSAIVPPLEAHELAEWFAEGVRAELTELEKKGSDQRYELHAGQRVTPDKSPYAIYRFTLADNTLVPEDASGKIEVQGSQFKASVVAQETSRVDIQIEGAEALGEFIARALLRVDDLALLRKLADVLEAVASGTEPVSPLTTGIFHPKRNGARKLPLPPMPALDRLTGEQRTVVEQACASEITFVWGPPGTGKTYVIAHVIGALIARGERVLMTSHTHAAVDQAIYETVKPAGPGGSTSAGPLANTDLERDGQIVRLGRVTNPKVPESVRLDSIVERKAEGIQSKISDLERKAGRLSANRDHLKADLAEWDRLNELQRRLVESKRRVSEAAALANHKLAQRVEASARIQECRQQVEQARRAWFFRARKVQQAQETLAAVERTFARACKVADDASASARDAERAAQSLQVETEEHARRCARLGTAQTLRHQLVSVEADLHQLEQRLTELRAHLDTLQRDIIANARVVAATLTKCYVGDWLDHESFDALIVDEISMALPPLLFVAARRALRRAILVGDFKQLPPIVRSDNKIADERLRQDAFHLADIARELEPTDHPSLTRLHVQRRMLPAIADAARHISYGPEGLEDHPDVLQRGQPDWLTFLPSNPLVVIDTVDLHCWSGRQAGSLSRFNLYSAQIAVELAQMAAAAIPRPGPTDARPIGIVTPYAAQGGLLKKLVEALELTDWVHCGTVHKLQGGEAELIIFDSVLDEPYWTARLCNPKRSKEVKRDLNVALTRARSKFVLVCSSEWLNRHAKPTSGLGQLWQYLRDHADLVSADELLKAGFSRRVIGFVPGQYQVPLIGDAPLFEVLNEETFFDRFVADLSEAKESIFGLLAYIGEYRWPRIEPYIRAALERGVEVTLIICVPPEKSKNPSYVQKVIASLRAIGALVILATGFHPKNVIIDSRILYTGSMNWGSHRGLEELVHRFVHADLAKVTLEYLQARHIRSASQQGKQPRTCPHCHGPAQLVNVRQLNRRGDKQPIKVGCADYQQTGCKYLVGIDERPPFFETPLCSIDKRTKYRRVRRGRGEVWECPKHPKECERFKVVPGDACGDDRHAGVQRPPPALTGTGLSGSNKSENAPSVTVWDRPGEWLSQQAGGESPPRSTEVSAARERTWEQMFAGLARYKEKHGHCDVPADWPEDPELARWVANQRRSWAEGTLGGERFRAFALLGFRFIA